MEVLIVSRKDGFNPAITIGVQGYRTHGEWIKVIHPGGYLDTIDAGSVVLFETKPVDGERRYWFGRVTHNAYWLVLDEPVNIFAVDTWFRNHQEMMNAHNGVLDFVDMDMQGELPF